MKIKFNIVKLKSIYRFRVKFINYGKWLEVITIASDFIKQKNIETQCMFLMNIYILFTTSGCY